MPKLTVFFKILETNQIVQKCFGDWNENDGTLKTKSEYKSSTSLLSNIFASFLPFKSLDVLLKQE